jgi:hypothetical protein
MVSDLMLAVFLQVIDFGPEDLTVPEHPECDGTVDKRSKLYQL